MSVLTRAQRKALRHLGRGQTITRTMQNGPLIRQCYTTDHYIRPTPGMNIVE